MMTAFTGSVLMRLSCAKCFIVIIFQSLGKASGQVLFYPLSTDERKLGLSLERLIRNESEVDYLLSVKS